MPTPWYAYDRGRGFTWAWNAIANHSGTDLQAPCGTDITSPVNGTILNAHTMPWGGQIDVATEDVPNYGPVVITFLHTSKQYVQAGDKVVPGESLGASGQPPPGAGFGGGCHIHFEVTHGGNAPYDSGVYSPSGNPNPKQYPLPPNPVLDWINTHAPPAAPVGGNLSQFSVPGQGPIVPTLPDVTGLLAPLSGIASFFAGLAGWLLNPARMLKMVLGIALVLGGLIIAFLPDIAGAALTATGAPELAPAAKAAAGGHPVRATRASIGAAGTRIGAERVEAKREVKRQRGVARARTLEEIRLTRQAQTRPLRANQQAQLIELRATRGAETERAARTAPLILAGANQRVPRPAPVQRAGPRGILVAPPLPATTPTPEPTLRAREGSLKPKPGDLQREAPPRTAAALGFSEADRKRNAKEQTKIAKQAQRTQATTEGDRQRVSQKVAGTKLPNTPPATDLAEEQRMLDTLRQRQTAGQTPRTPRRIPKIFERMLRANQARTRYEEQRAANRRRGQRQK